MPHPKPQTCEFAGMISLRTLRWEEYLGLAMWVQCTRKKWKRQVEEKSQREMRLCKTGWRDDTMLLLKMDKGGHKPGNRQLL